MSFHDQLEKQANRSGGSPVYLREIGNRKVYVLKINAKGKKVGWYVREGAMRNDKGPFKTLKEANAAIK